jgi:hypothetical protein
MAESKVAFNFKPKNSKDPPFKDLTLDPSHHGSLGLQTHHGWSSRGSPASSGMTFS